MSVQAKTGMRVTSPGFDKTPSQPGSNTGLGGLESDEDADLQPSGVKVYACHFVDCRCHNKNRTLKIDPLTDMPSQKAPKGPETNRHLWQQFNVTASRLSRYPFLPAII